MSILSLTSYIVPVATISLLQRKFRANTAFEKMVVDFFLFYGMYAFGWTAVLYVSIPYFRRLWFDKTSSLVEPNWQRDVVYLIQAFPRKAAISPFCLKVELFLRLHKVPFQTRKLTPQNMKKGKRVPIVELNGKQITDSRKILQEISEKYHIEENYEDEEQAYFGHSLERKADSQTKAIMGYMKMKPFEHTVDSFMNKYAPDSWKGVLFPVTTWAMSRKISRQITVAASRFIEGEYGELIRAELKRLTRVLGDKPFLFGDEPTQADCTVYGELACIEHFPVDLFDDPKFAPLKAWMERFRERVYGPPAIDAGDFMAIG